MQLKSYRADTMQQAIEMIRRDLGPEASVLYTRQVRRGLLARWFVRRQIEVTASPDARVPSRFPSSHARPEMRASSLPALLGEAS